MGFLFFNLAYVPFHPMFTGWLVFLSCHCFAPVVMSLIFCLVVTFRLTGWSTCHVNFLSYSFFCSLLPNIPAGPIHSVPWASSAHFVPWASLTYFIISYIFHSHGLLLNSLGFHGPITTSLPLGLLAFKTTPFTNSFLWASPTHFYFLFVSYNSHGPTTSILGASSTHLLSLRPIIILVSLLTIIPIILAQWSLFYYSFFLSFSYCWVSSTIGPFLSKMGINTLQ